MIISNKVKELALKASLEIQLDETGEMRIQPYSSKISTAICDYAQGKPRNRVEVLSALSSIETGNLPRTRVEVDISMMLHSEADNLRHRYPSYA